MSGEHFRAFVWLHWRLRVNQFKRGGIANFVIFLILAVGAVLLALGAFLVFFLVGMLGLGEALPIHLILIWDGIVAALVFFWMIGLLSDLQRSEAVSLTKFLHLPVSLTGAFVLNYLTSLLSFNLIMFVPAMAGLSLGLIISRGPTMLLLIPLVAAFVLMVTALTYQFQGWLASLMANKRRRRTVVVVVSMVFLLITQLPNLVNILRPWEGSGKDDLLVQFHTEQEELKLKLARKEITFQQYNERQAAIVKTHQESLQARGRQTWEAVERVTRLLNVVLPPGWLPLAAGAIAEADLLTAVLGLAGMTILGSASLWRAYRTTLKMYTGAFTAGAGKPVAAPAPVPAVTTERDRAAARFLERVVPGVSEQAAAVALAGFRSLTRAPEAKMLLLTPVLIVVVFGGLLFRQPMEIPVALRFLVPFGVALVLLLTLVQLIGNQFGYDRSGFRIFVLSPARRSDILLGKNLAVAPLVLAFTGLAAAGAQAVLPMGIDSFLAVLPQLVSMFFVFCLLANCLSILVPMSVAAGSMRPTQMRVFPVVMHLLLPLFLPIIMAPTLLPWGVAALLEHFGIPVPVCFVLSLVECVGIGYLYRWILGWQGAWLQHREQRILETVTAKAE